jgi:rhodanese-related sulfurtransferase
MPRIVDRDGVQRLMRDGAQIVDVLPREEFAEEHLPGAINIPLKELNAEIATRLRKDRPIVVYCYDFQ